MASRWEHSESQTTKRARRVAAAANFIYSRTAAEPRYSGRSSGMTSCTVTTTGARLASGAAK